LINFVEENDSGMNVLRYSRLNSIVGFQFPIYIYYLDTIKFIPSLNIEAYFKLIDKFIAWLKTILIPSV